MTTIGASMITMSIRVTLAALALAACGSKQQDGLPPTTEWASTSTAAASSEPSPRAGFATAPTASGAPHGPIGTDVSKMGLPPPEPDRPLDPSHRVRGTIKAAPAVEGQLHDGAAVFVIVKRDDGGKPSGPPLAVDKLTWRPGMPFELTERQAMIAGTQLTGDVIVSARYDQDGDALTKQPGDVVGQVRVKVPAEAVVLALDTVLP